MENEVKTKPEIPALKGQDKGTQPVQNTGKEIKMSFPREFSHKVFVRRKKNLPNLPIEGDFIDESIIKIGASWREKSVLRGLEAEEESRWLPKIIGTQVTSPNWEAEAANYWKNISRVVPLTNKDGSGGLELEVGLRYKSQEDYDTDQNAPREEGAVINPKGEPISMADYILWRYCLRYSRVANSIEDINKSPKIEMYLFSREKDIKDKKASFELRKKASQLLYKRLNERDWVDHILRLLIVQDGEAKVTIKDLSTITDDEKDIMMDNYANKNPGLFLSLGEDRNLELKSFVEICIALGLLHRIANTNSVSMDGNTIGNTMDEVVTFLRNPENQHSLATLKAQSAVRP